ncbi:Hypothetical predicted protein [Paramuricea clavata]|uniref:Uncharacterized protein n=1 Tax=Paramuricea clavata TaxID=317549 RepID=A0A6S7G669_PARCT|nr:Hypothetical predicted protein [Paramuricea clavata]
MPRGRSRARSSPSGGLSSRSNVPAARPSSSVVPPQSTQVQRGPGLFGQMASTAAGVAIGSTVGHVVGGAITGGFHDNNDTTPAGQQPANTMQASNNPCQFEFEQFVQCAQNQHDITFCKGFNEVLKQCKVDHGLM